MDAYRHGEEFIVLFDFPGARPETIALSVEKNVLTVRAERRSTRGEADEVVVAERPQGSFSRQLFLGESLDPDRIQAAYDNGVLTLTIPVAERAKARQISIDTAYGGPKAVDANSRQTESSGV
jgi:HSP20 family protein